MSWCHSCINPKIQLCFKLLICRDITSTKKAEDALKAKTQQLKSFIENNVDSILIFNMQGNVVSVNKAFETTFGWTKEEIINVGLYDLPFIPAEIIDEVRTFEAAVKSGKLVVQIRKRDTEKIVIRVIDQGIGMSKEVLSKLGQPFYTTKEKGTGLGFMISKRIIENHFGEVHIESEINKGTIIEVTLPIRQKADDSLK